MATEKVVKNTVYNIVKSASGNTFTKTERLILNEKQDNKKREKAVRKATSILRKVNPEKAFHELSVVMKKQAEDFLRTDCYKAHKASNYKDLLHLVGDSFLRKIFKRY